ncbi:MAG: GNAT family acetyltransferase, partial [Firmicutes bacterium]|nr:GNAT family acetyltransferase [Bacillota bacterium]
MNVVIENVLDLLESGGEVQLARDLSAFSCPQNAEIETFIRQRAIDFARRKLSITYLVTDLADGELLGYFTLAHKAIEIEAEGLSQTSRRRIGRYARY